MRIITLLILVFLFFCSNSDKVSGSISDVDLEIASLYGYVVNNDGEFVSSTEIILFLPDTILSKEGKFGTPIDTFYTDDAGKYQFDSLSFGTYSILANYEDSLFAENLFIQHDTLTFVGIDTLREPGAIKGSVVLDNGNNMGVLIYVPGTSHIAVSDSIGNFTLSDIPADSSYTIIFQYYGYAIVQLSKIKVTSGDTTSLSPVILSKNEYPIGVKGVLDTITNTVTISWNKMISNDISGYIVYRKDSSQTALFPEQLNLVSLITDTIFKDTLDDEHFSQSDTITFQYQVKAKNSKEDLSPFSEKVFVKAISIRDSSTLKTLSISYPEENNTLIGSENVILLWKYSGLIDSVKLSFTPNNGASWFSISNNILNKGSFLWSVPNIQSSLCKYKIQALSDTLLYDESELFTINASEDNNLLKNGDFSSGMAYWKLNYFSGAKGSINIENGTCFLEVDSGGTLPWHVSLAQQAIPLMQGYIYKFSFDAKAESERTIKAGLAMGHDPWTTYSELAFNLTTEMKHYSGELIMSSDDDYRSDFIFAIGGDTSSVVVDNLFLEISN